MTDTTMCQAAAAAHAAASGLPLEVIAALSGAVAGAASSVLIEVGKWFFHRRARARAIRLALYLEIFNHSIFETGSTDGEPNFLLIGFTRASYDAHLGEIADLLPEPLVGDIGTYYAKVTLAAAQLPRIEEDTVNALSATQEMVRLEQKRGTISAPLYAEEEHLLKTKGAQVASRLSSLVKHTRFLLATAMWQQKLLLKQLRAALKHDPAQQPVDVLPQYRAWLAKAVQGKVDDPEQ